VEAAILREDVERITRHDLKAPLTAIIGVPQFLLENCELNATQKELVQGIEDAGRRMLQMINASLDLFKMERGTYTLRPVPVDLIETARTVFFELEELARVKAVPLVIQSGGEASGEGDQAMVLGEPLLCHSLLANLCKNAVEASPDGEAVKVSVDDGDPITLIIENAGEVAPEIADRFFEKFTTAGKDTGTGLGTYSAKLIAEIQRGSIALDRSDPGRTRVRVLLPSANPKLQSGLANSSHGDDAPLMPNRS
jgi:signal transduction histidine kinase